MEWVAFGDHEFPGTEFVSRTLHIFVEDVFKAIDVADRGGDGVELEKLLVSSQSCSTMKYACDEVFFSPYREHNREYNDDDKKSCVFEIQLRFSY